MKAKDTVKTNPYNPNAEEQTERLCWAAYEEGENDQAKISFKAGYKQAVLNTRDINAKLALAYEGDMKQHKLAGIKEVVDWMVEPCPHVNSKSYFKPKCICPECKQAQLKEWGIKEGK